jgi:hypothetical protein
MWVPSAEPFFGFKVQRSGLTLFRLTSQTYQPLNSDELVKSPKTVMPDLRSLSRIAMRGYPELNEITEFRLSRLCRN